jgi:hypothetical protein
MRNPFGVTVYDKDFTFVGLLNDYTSLSVTPRHNQIGTAELVVPSDHRRLPDLAAIGARLIITYEGEHLMSGYLPTRDGAGPERAGQFTFHLKDDLWLVWRLLGWPVPGAALNAQGVKRDVRTGDAETVAKGFITANAAHLVDTVTVATNLNRGDTVTVESRMAVLADVLMPAVDAAGIGVSVRQSGSGLLVDVYEPTVFPHTLSERSGTITDWSWSQTDEESTVSIVGGPNENTSREFRRVRDSARETALGYSIESFVDARSAENNTEMDAAGTAALAEAGPKSGFRVSLSESKHFRYGGPNGVHVGDSVTVDVGGQTLTDVLREATLTFDRDSGVQVVPAIGERTDDPNKTLLTFLSKLTRGVRDLRTR